MGISVGDTVKVFKLQQTREIRGQKSSYPVEGFSMLGALHTFKIGEPLVVMGTKLGDFLQTSTVKSIYDKTNPELDELCIQSLKVDSTQLNWHQFDDADALVSTLNAVYVLKKIT